MHELKQISDLEFETLKNKLIDNETQE